MIQADKIHTALSGFMGWRQSVNSDFAIVDASNQLSSSGEYFQDFSPLVTIENIKNNQQYASISDADFNTLLNNLYKSAYVKVFKDVFSKNDFVENKVLFPYENVLTDTITNSTSFVGYEFQPANRKEFLTTINTLFTTFDGVDSVKVLVFHSSKQDPILNTTVTTVANEDVASSVDWDFSATEYAGGKYYIGYLRSGLTAKAINREWDSSNVANSFCTFSMRPILVDGWDSETLFDVDDVDYEDETYGLNFDITTWKDYTNIIIQNKNRFTKAIGLQVAVDVLDLMLKSTRSNRNERQMNANILLERDGILDASKDSTRVDAVIPRLKRELKMLKENFVEQPLIVRGTL